MERLNHAPRTPAIALWLHLGRSRAGAMRSQGKGGAGLTTSPALILTYLSCSMILAVRSSGTRSKCDGVMP